MTRLLPILFVLLSGVLTAQTASYTYVNQKAPFSNPSPAMLTAQSTPKIGGTLRLQVPYSWRQRNGTGEDFFLATGLSNPNVLITPLGGWLYSSADVIIPTPMSPLGIPGTAMVSIKIPNDAKLIGFRFYQQVWGPSARLSRGGLGTIGK